MGIFNKIRNVYRAITGNISVEQEQGYKDWLAVKNSYVIDSNYNKKIRITQASKQENLRVQRELQARVNASALEKNCVYETKFPLHPSTQRYYPDLPTQRMVVNTLALERGQKKQEICSSNKLSLQERINAARNRTLEQNRELARGVFSRGPNQIQYSYS